MADVTRGLERPAPSGVAPRRDHPLVTRLDHVAVAVHDLADAVRLYVDLLGGQVLGGGDDENLKIRTVQLRFEPSTKIELLQPLSEDSYLAEHLRRRGPGIHHLTCFVDDVQDAVAELTAAGYETVDTSLVNDHWQETYVRPSSGFGTLIQLASTPLEWTSPMMPEGATIDDVLAGRLLWVKARPEWKES